MRSHFTIPPWKSAPFVRLVIPVFVGVLLQWYLKPEVRFMTIGLGAALSAYCVLFVFKLARLYKLRWVQGLLIQATLLFLGFLLTWNNDIRNHKRWFGHTYSSADYLVVSMAEPLVKKEKSYKSIATISYVIHNRVQSSCTGQVIVYFMDLPRIEYGDRILLRKPLQAIKNTGNPAAFDYARYAAFQQQFHTVFLREDDYVAVPGKDRNAFKAFIFRSREHILNVLRLYVSKEKSIGGIAEALLIGYKHDLDKDILQAYSNAGVVHIIAISGLHLGLIYVMLSWLMSVLPWVKKCNTFKAIVILGCLWLFSILTGSSASVLRSALMFTCILIGKTYFRQTSIYNAIAASAFMLVCYNPYLLWDVGFQLSYLAVLGIVWLQKPILNLLYVKNKWLGKVWSMVAVTLAAQLAAFPLCLYYFHQFPNWFLVTNLVAVPLSTVILSVEIFLLCFSWLDPVAIYVGKFISFLIDLMNDIIVYCNSLPWSVTDHVYADVFTTLLLYGIVISGSAWLINRKSTVLKYFLVSIILFTFLHIYADVVSLKQNKILVYNISKSQAIDFIHGTTFYFLGDSALQQPGFAHSFHIRPARIFFQARQEKRSQVFYDPVSGVAVCKGNRVFIIEKSIAFDTLVNKVPVDIIIISRNPDLKIAGLSSALKPSVIVFDASNSLWKIENWKKECSALLLPFHSVPDQGAFVADIK